jgi:glycosyltransferase involved in cell wall biosynthesis
MKINYDYQIFGWQVYGGISRYFFELANNISNIPGVEASVISPFYINAYLAHAGENLSIRGWKIPVIPRTGRIIRMINQLIAARTFKSDSPALVHETYYAARRYASPKSKVVLTVFDMIHEKFPECFPVWDSTASEKAAAVARADHVICISEHTRRDLIDILGVDPKKTSVVHLGFSLTAGSASRVPAEDRPFLLYVGSRGGYKNFEKLLRAYASEPELQATYDLIAFGGGSFSAKERSLMAGIGLGEGRVRQVAGSDAVLAGLYKSAALFVYPSRYEGFGIPPLEAMSFSCPVVCSNASSIPEVAGDAAHYFEPDSIESMVHAIQEVLGSQSLRQSLVDRGLERIKMFSWERCAEQTLEVYKEVLK